MEEDGIENRENDLRPRSYSSLRWYYPDQVLRVSKAHFDLSLSKGPPSGCPIMMTFSYSNLSYHGSGDCQLFFPSGVAPPTMIRYD